MRISTIALTWLLGAVLPLALAAPAPTRIFPSSPVDHDTQAPDASTDSREAGHDAGLGFFVSTHKPHARAVPVSASRSSIRTTAKRRLAPATGRVRTRRLAARQAIDELGDVAADALGGDAAGGAAGSFRTKMEQKFAAATNRIQPLLDKTKPFLYAAKDVGLIAAHVVGAILNALVTIPVMLFTGAR